MDGDKKKAESWLDVICVASLFLPTSEKSLVYQTSVPNSTSCETFHLDDKVSTPLHTQDDQEDVMQKLIQEKESALASAGPTTTTATLHSYCQTHYQMDPKISDPTIYEINVRGGNYMKDKKKIPAGQSLGELLHVDIWANPHKSTQNHIALIESKRKESIIRYFKDHHPERKIFLVNFQIPGTPFLSLVCYWVIPGAQTDRKKNEKFERLLDKFMSYNTNNSFRNNRFKLIPKIVDGPWLVMKSVPEKPALIGNKLTQRYFQGDNYFEVDIDLSSSTIASSIVSICRGYCTKIVVDIAFVIQGETEQELPESIFAGVRFSYLNLSNAKPLPHQ